MSDDPELELRLSDAERRGVQDALAAHAETGRLGADEVENRQLAAARAVTWADVVPLFADLPSPHPPGMPGEQALATPRGASASPVAVPGARRGLTHNQRSAVTLVTTFAALGAFFWTHHWMWFLAIPAVAAVLKWNDPDDDGGPRGRR